MDTEDKKIIVFITVDTNEQAKKIAKLLLEEHLVGCVNIINGITSMFWWKDKIDVEQEVLMLAKTSQSKFTQLKERVLAVHPYEVPEIVSTIIDDIHKDYLNWLTESLRK